ncbi:MAG: glycosyltransferase [Microbacterium sp.]
MSIGDPALEGVRILLLTKTDFTEPRDGGTLRLSAIAARLQAEGAIVDAVAVKAADGWSPSAAPAPRRGHLSRAARVAARTAAVASASVARWFSLRTVRTIGGLLDRHRYDAAVVEYSQLLIYAPLLRGIPIVCDLHNIESQLLDNYAASASSLPRRLVARYEAARVRRLERGMFRHVSAATTVSGHDTELLRALTGAGDELVLTAPNGVSETAFVQPKRRAEGVEVVFIASLGWQPNVDAVEWLVGSVWPQVRAADPAARLRIIGRSPRASVRELDGADGVTVHADVPETWPFLSSASVATAPLLAAGGTRLKILEALGTGTPVVATSLGALGLEAASDQGALTIVDSPAEFAAALLRVSANPPADSVVRGAAGAYRWQNTLAPLVETLTRLTSR